MINYDFSKLNPFKKRKRRVRQVQKTGDGSVSIQSGGSIHINGEEVEYVDDGDETRFGPAELCSIIGFITLTLCATILEATGGSGGGLWIVVVLWAFKLGEI